MRPFRRMTSKVRCLRTMAGFFVGGGPQDHFGEDRGEIDSLGGERVNQLAPVCGILFGGDDFVGFQSA